jgi:gliding motility-associated-like protein
MGTYPFSLSLESDFGCVASIDTIVNVFAVPVVAFTPTSACQSAPEVFYNHSTIEAGSIVEWIWQVEGQMISSPDSLNYAFNGWGDLSLSLTPVSDHGCDDTLSVFLVVHPAPQATLHFDSGCLGAESSFHADATIPIGGIVSQEWSFGDSHPNEMGPDVDNLYDTTGLYMLGYTAISNLGCITQLSDSIYIYGVPEVDFTIDPAAMCAETPFMLFDLSTVESPSSIAEWSWWLDQNPVSTYQNPQLTWAQPGTYDLTLSVTSDHGCSNDSTAQNAVTIFPRPSAGFLSNPEAYMYNPLVEVTNTASEDVTYWYYDFGDGSNANFPEGEHWYEEHDTYLITQYVRNTFGCRDTAMHEVVIHPDMLVYIPNAFTPDDNGHNEMFLPVISGFDVTLYEFRIFDRWGIEVFETTNRTEGWDGRFNGGPAEAGTYSWAMTIRGQQDVTIHHKTGNVMLLR